MKRRRWIWPLVALALAAAALLYDRARSREVVDVPPPLPPEQRAPLRFDVPATMSPGKPAPAPGAAAPDRAPPGPTAPPPPPPKDDATPRTR